MRLSRLHIAGFKSFPDRAELGFDDGVTAIVGPNGCGKSNVVDAITWVLGEQSAKSLRGDRMEDVIFNGSDARKPTGAAEVRLKFTQVTQAPMAPMVAAVDLDPLLDSGPLVARDVEIGRRLYRSGESEYLIDGEVCRLRDIHDLLMDSGLGVKAYAVIEQGKIGQILSSRPTERRMLIEEAAGVTKYKSRRRAAELKLEAAQLNLTRIDDIVFEVEKQRGALKRQAARARRYKALREELRRWEQLQFARRYAALGREIDAAERQLAEGRAREVGASARLAELEAESEAVRLGLTEAEALAAARREAVHQHQLEMGRRQQQIEFDRQQSAELARQAGDLAAEVAALEARREPSTQALAAQQEAARQARAALEEGATRLAEREAGYARAQADVQGVERESDQTRAAVLASGTTLAALRQARDNAAAVGDRVAAERERLDLEARELTAETERATRQLADAEQAIAGARTAHESLAARRAAAEIDLTRQRADREQRAQEIAVLERELASKDARLRSLDELEASRATFGDAARYLLSEAGPGLRQYGAVADHLVVEPSFERAVDALLGELLQHVLVDRIDDVGRALQLLTERNAGRCGFVVRDEIGADPSPEAPLVVPPGARALSSVVRAIGPHAAAVGRLIGRALIADSFDAAQALARVVSVPVAARTGEVFHGPWLVEGGSRQDVRGILESRAEVRALRDEVQARAADLRTRQADFAEFDPAIAAADAALAVLVADMHQQEKDLVALAARVSQAAEGQGRISRRLEVVTTERGRTEEEQRAAEGRRDEAAAAIEAHETGQRQAEGNLDSVLARLQAARDAADACLRLVNDSRADMAARVERMAALQADVARLDEAARELDARIAGRRSDADRIDQRRAELSEAVSAGSRQLDQDVITLDALQLELRGLEERVTALRDEFSSRDQAIRAARHALDAIRGEVVQFEVGHARAVSDLTHLGTACVDAVGLSLDDVVQEVARLDAEGAYTAPGRRAAAADEDEGVEAAEEPTTLVDAGAPDSPERAIATVKARIDRLGPVNMMAIEQFDELESRHTFLTTQRQDLLDSISQTGEAIRKIDKTTRERFAEAFESINRHFEKTFTTLFGGGRAGLVQIEQEHDQESGIDIIAQPPGKRLQNVQLLSGGEKALTAMALMFAIFKHRPSPFCLLDEIDAPLDDANIGRFVEMLMGMQTHTQFILITHNRKTMEIANRLYGVTMEEPGVSKLISLQLH
jgi:chromosome segregation protein